MKSFTNTGRLRMALLPKSKYHYRFGTEKDAGIRWGLRKFNVIFLLSGGKDQRNFTFAFTYVNAAKYVLIVQLLLHIIGIQRREISYNASCYWL